MDARRGRSTGTCSRSPGHAGVQNLVRDLNQVYKDEPALWEVDFEPSGFYWIEPNDADRNVVAFARVGADPARTSWSAS